MNENPRATIPYGVGVAMTRGRLVPIDRRPRPIVLLTDLYDRARRLSLRRGLRSVPRKAEVR